MIEKYNSPRLILLLCCTIALYLGCSLPAGKYPQAERNVAAIEDYADNKELLDNLFKKCQTDSTSRDPELVRKASIAKEQRTKKHATFAYLDNRVANLNASHVKLNDNVNFVLTGAPLNRNNEIRDHLYYAIIDLDCTLWFTLNECRDRPKFWTAPYLANLNFPGNWKITNVEEEVVLETVTRGKHNPKLVKSTLLAENGQTSKTIIHYHYDNWLDHHPAPCEKILLECAKIACNHLQTTGKPVGINCKGGVGRTGVLANLVYAMQYVHGQLEEGKQIDEITINLVELNYDLRRERGGLVSYPPQFAQVWQVFREHIRPLAPASAARQFESFS